MLLLSLRQVAQWLEARGFPADSVRPLHGMDGHQVWMPLVGVFVGIVQPFHLHIVQPNKLYDLVTDPVFAGVQTIRARSADANGR